jgi:virulence-associated protein VagC
LEELKQNRNGIKAMVELSPLEKANKALSYRLLEKKRVHVKDLGDILILSPAGQPNNAPHKLQLDKQPDEVENELTQVIDYARVQHRAQ